MIMIIIFEMILFIRLSLGVRQSCLVYGYQLTYCIFELVFLGCKNIYVKSHIFVFIYILYVVVIIIFDIHSLDLYKHKLLHPTIHFRLNLFSRARFLRIPLQRLIVKKILSTYKVLSDLQKSSNTNITMESRSPMARYIKIPIKLPRPSGLWLPPRHP